MAVAATGDVDAPAPGSGSGSARRDLAARLLVTSPDLVVCALAGFSIGPMILLLASHFSPVPVFVTGVVGAAAALWLRGVDVELPDRRTVLFTGLAVAVVLAWFLVNVGFTGQNVYATRDPATYDITARWLMDNPTLHIATHPEIFGTPVRPCSGDVGLLCNGSAGFSPVSTAQVYSQGNHLMPALAAVGGWLFGVGGLFRTNLVLGACALFVLFGLVRRVAGAPLAVLATAAMAVSMPMVYVSRDTYSEPLMMLFLVGGLGLLYRATTTYRVRDFALAGFVAGCAALVRIDSYGALLSILLAAIVITGLAPPGSRRAAIVRSLALLVGCAAPTVVGWLDVTWLSFGYYRDQRGNILLEVKGAVALLLVGLIAIAVVWRPRVRAWLAAERTRRRLSTALTGGLVLVFVVLLSRPLWAQTHGPVDNPTVANWQRESHVTVDGTLLYNETALKQVGTYFGWVTVVLAVAGYAMLLHAMIRRRNYALVGILGMGLSMSGLYLWNWEITPDQPWAMRRFVPVVVPLMLLAAMVGLRGLRGLHPRGVRGRRLLRVVAVLAPVAVVVVPAVITAPMVTVREEVPQYSQVQAICAALGRNGAVLELDMPTLYSYGQTMRSYCGVPSIGLVGATPAQLASVNASVSAHGRRLFVMWQPQTTPPPLAPGSSKAPFSTVTVQRWPNVIGRPPTEKGGRRVIIYLATVDADGKLLPVPPE